MAAVGDGFGYLGQVQGHGCGIAPRKDQSGPLSLIRADRAEDVGRGGALVVRCCGTGAALGPTPGDLVLLSDPGFVGEPNFYIGSGNAFVMRDLVQSGWETFLKSSMAPAAWA